MKKLTLAFNSTLIFIVLLSTVPVQGMESDSSWDPADSQFLRQNRRLWWNAVYVGEIKEVKRLIAEGIADLKQDRNGDTVLTYIISDKASQKRSGTITAIAKILIEAGVDVNSVNKYGDTALLHAVKNKNIELVNVLIKAGANVDIVYRGIFMRRYIDNTGTNVGGTALLYAIRYSNIAVVKALIKAGADVNIIGEMHEAALLFTIKCCCVVESERAGLAKALIKAGAQCDNRSLVFAIKSKQLEISMDLINPVVKPMVRKKIETLLMIYNEGRSQLSLLPREILKIIITCAMDRELVHCLHPQVLVDNVPLETLAMFIKDGTLDQDAILKSWQNKIDRIVQSLKDEKTLNNNKIQAFVTYALTNIEKSLTTK